MVEPVHPSVCHYGTDVERISMTFREFLSVLRDQDGPHPYLTTQYSDDDPEAETIFPPPTNALKDEFPVAPRIMGNLFLQQVNLWLGKSKDGSSSGLHHDFHDNIYCLLKGRKRFVLFPPSEVKNLYPYGTLIVHHPNGLIAYEDIPVRADGLSKRVACKARVRALELQIDALKAKAKSKGKGKIHLKEMKVLMEAHDAALDELAEVTLEDQEGEDDMDDFDALMGDLDDLEHVAGRPSSSGEDNNEAEEEEEWKGIGHSEDGDHEQDGADTGSEEDSEEEAGCKETVEGARAGPSEPSSFSRIATAHLHRYLGIPTTAVLPAAYSPSDFPGLQNTTEPYVVELTEGEMLYLPASWWHEVTSTSTGDVHMAFNYWFYPPDALDSFDAPYRDTQVWDYLRKKGAGSGESMEAGEQAQSGKRTRGSVDGGASKKARR
ncbi:Clavaminate synthase-like protein [Trametes gibbosa]|nr:Clavaminate synthase-like protein [Trametes gibbosa]